MKRRVLILLFNALLGTALATSQAMAAETAKHKVKQKTTLDLSLKKEDLEEPSAHQPLPLRKGYKLPDFSTQARRPLVKRQDDLPYGAGYEARQHVLSEDIMFAPVSGGKNMGGGGFGGEMGGGGAGGAGAAGGQGGAGSGHGR